MDCLLEQATIESAGQWKLLNVSGLGKSLSGLLKGLPETILGLGNKLKMWVDSFGSKQQSRGIFQTAPLPPTRKARLTRELQTRISAVQPPPDFHAQVFAKGPGTLSVIESQVARDFIGNEVAILNGKEYSDVSHVNQIPKDQVEKNIILKLDDAVQQKIKSKVKVLEKVLKEFQGGRDDLEIALAAALQPVDENDPKLDVKEIEALAVKIRKTAAQEAAKALKEDLVKICFPNSKSEELTIKQQEQLQVVLLQCCQGSVAPLQIMYFPKLTENGSLAGVTIEQENGQNETVIQSFQNTLAAGTPSQFLQKHVITTSGENELAVTSTYRMFSMAYDGNPMFPVAEYRGVVEAQFAFKENVITPKEATVDLQLTEIHFDELKRRNSRLVMPAS